MNMLYIQYPSYIHPEIFPGVPVLGLIRWYGLMYIFAFATAWFILKKLRREGMLDTADCKPTEDDMFSCMASGIVFLLIGARVFSTLIYDTTGEYIRRPWLIFWPFSKDGHFTGLAGMSYHGGVIGGLLGVLIWCRRHKKPLLQWTDAMCTAIPLGYTFGRVGNFLNGELFGRITAAPWGIIFPAAQKFSASKEWVQDFAARIGLHIDNVGLVNLPRHPSQLYEAFFEGIVLWAILWSLRRRRPFNGFLTALYVALYGLFRFFIEYFREPDADLGFRIAKDVSANLYENVSFFNISTGQILCLLMFCAGLAALLVLRRLSKKRQ